jgi:hypothetical protein
MLIEHCREDDRAIAHAEVLLQKTKTPPVSTLDKSTSKTEQARQTPCARVAQPQPSFWKVTNASVNAFYATQVQENKCKKRTRVGGPSDGGYVMCGDEAPAGLGEVTALLSLGINGADDWGNDASKRYKAPVFQFDCYDQTTPNCDTPYGCHFFSKCIVAPSKLRYSREQSPGKDFITIDQAVKLAEGITQKPGGEMIMKQDIETSEWKMFEEMPESLMLRFQQIVGEWHAPDLVDEKVLPRITLSLQRIQKYFHPLHTHPNDCCKPTLIAGDHCYMMIYEASYLRRQGFEDAPIASPMRLPLDIDVANGGNFQFHLNQWPFNPDERAVG